ncbi:hypothetical protein C1H46_014515 [Malus baccata]|uniref:Uncharacterized protein n=1 Tax=Malus baccata TaxID=106549 RepID=A0A540MNU7_MALBA|nr:hypothetical protein C1H46_014515 [Malus baccata]
MADLNLVKVVEVCKVAPQPSTPDSLAIPESLPLTMFVLLWLRFAPVQRLFFYEINNPNSSDTKFTHSTLIPKPKTSLSLTLQQFLPLAGNVIWPKESPKPILRYVRGDGVLLNIDESDSDFHHIVSSNSFNIEAKEYHPLIPQMPVSHSLLCTVSLSLKFETLLPLSLSCRDHTHTRSSTICSTRADRGHHHHHTSSVFSLPPLREWRSP